MGGFLLCLETRKAFDDNLMLKKKSSKRTAVLALYLVGLISAFLNKAEPMTVIGFVHSKVLEAVSHQCTLCQSCIGGSSVGQFASRVKRVVVEAVGFF